MSGSDHPPLRQVRAEFDDITVTVYQAYSEQIADAALEAGTFVPPFRFTRMTWIKPSFLWMMYRSGWATKPGQERVLAIRITREGFEKALSSACLSHFDAAVCGSHEEWLRCLEASPVRVQWDPERTINLDPLPWRSLQVGLAGVAARKYVSEWITDITDITTRAREIHHRSGEGRAALPRERPYPLPPDIAMRIGASIS